jgi:hypothetical protein
MSCSGRSPSAASCRKGSSTTPATTFNYHASRERVAILRRAASTDEAAPVEPARPAPRLDVVAQPEPPHRPRQPRCAQPARAGFRPAQRLLDPARPVGQQGERLGQIDSAGATSSSPRSTNIISAASVGQIASRRRRRQDLPAAGRQDLSAGPQRRSSRSTWCSSAASRQVAPARPDCAGQADARRSPPALLIPTGAFFNDTGGNWVFVVAGRQQRGEAPGPARPPQRRIYRSAGGLKPGERVITSSYTGLVDKDRLDLRLSRRIERIDTKC